MSLDVCGASLSIYAMAMALFAELFQELQVLRMLLWQLFGEYEMTVSGAPQLHRRRRVGLCAHGWIDPRNDGGPDAG